MLFDLAAARFDEWEDQTEATVLSPGKSAPRIVLACQRVPRADLMKATLMMGCALLFAAPMLAQDAAVKIMLAATSTTPAAYLVENLPAAGCPNVSIVTDAADYTLEAQGGDFEGAKGSAGPHGPQGPRPRAKYTLYKDGTSIFATTPIKEKSAVKDLCKFLLHGSKK